MKAGNGLKSRRLQLAFLPLFPPDLPVEPPRPTRFHKLCVVQRRGQARGSRGGRYDVWERVSGDLSWPDAVRLKIALNCGRKHQRCWVFDASANSIVRTIRK